ADTDGGGAPHDRQPALAAGPAGGEGPADLLLEREEQPRPGEEHEAPQDPERRVGAVAQRLVGDEEEPVRRQPGDDQPQRDRGGAGGKGVAAPRGLQQRSHWRTRYSQRVTQDTKDGAHQRRRPRWSPRTVGGDAARRRGRGDVSRRRSGAAGR